jgi:prolyl-tRNA synthetase
MMHDGKALQSGTSHNFGDGFAKAFGIQYTAKDNTLQYVHQTSWGLSTRIIGALIMVHGDDNGLVLPPRVAPVQLFIIPVQGHKPGVMEKAAELKAQLAKVARVKIDDTDKQPGWKFAEHEMRGVPIRLEVGPKDMEKEQVVLVRRDTHEKLFVPMAELESTVAKLLDDIHDNMLQKALTLRESRTTTAKDMDEFVAQLDGKQGFIRAMWCGDRACEDAIKEKTAATSRCMPFDQTPVGDTCVCCGKPASKLVVWGRAY